MFSLARGVLYDGGLVEQYDCRFLLDLPIENDVFSLGEVHPLRRTELVECPVI